MDIINFTSEITIAIVKHGWSASTLIIFIFALFKFAPFRRFVMRNLPRKLQKLDSNVTDVRSDIRRMERKIDALMAAGGVTWDAVSSNGKNAPNVTTGRTMKSLSPQVVSARVTIAAYFTRLKATYLSQQRRMKMRQKLLSRKFLMALATGILIVLNDGLDMGLEKDTIMMVVSIIGGWIFVEGGADIVKMKKEAIYDYSGIESERKAAEDSSAA